MRNPRAERERPAAGHLLLLLLAFLILPACGQEPAPHAPPPVADAGSRPRRIVTLAPALTQMVVDLGEADALVGVAQNDAAAPEGLPVVGNFLNIDTERLLSVRPTHVFMMAGREGVPPRLQSLAEAGGFEVVSYPYPDSIREAMAILAPEEGDTPDVRELGEVLDLESRAATLRRQTVDELQRIEASTQKRPRPRVLMVFGTDPIMASGPGTVLDELLRYAGGANAAADAAITAPTFDREALVAMDPQVILFFQPGGAEPQPGDPRLGPFTDLPIQAAQESRIHLVTDPLALLPSTNMPQVAKVMAEAIHSEPRPSGNGASLDD